jgi:hypothetical protein
MKAKRSQSKVENLKIYMAKTEALKTLIVSSKFKKENT